MTLYELTGQFLQVNEMAANGEIDEETMQGTLESIECEIEVKAENYAKVIRNLESDAEMLKKEEERLYERRKTIENNIKRIKTNLENCMIAVDKKKFKTDLFSFNIQKNAPALIIDNKNSIPAEYLIQQEPKVDTVNLKKYLKENKADFAHLEQSESLRIR